MPIADTTTTTSSPARRVRATWSATARMRSGSATEVPPNFWTRSTAIKATGDSAASSKVSAEAPRSETPCGIHSAAMPSADKRARKKENARAAREEREAAVRRKKRLRSSVTIGIVVAIFVGLVVILSVSSGGKKKDKATTSTTTKTPATTPTTPSTPVTTAKTFKVAAADDMLDPAKTYTATISTNFGDIGVALDTKNAPIGAAHFITLARRRRLRRIALAPDHQGLRDPGRRARRRHLEELRPLGGRRGAQGQVRARRRSRRRRPRPIRPAPSTRSSTS